MIVIHRVISFSWPRDVCGIESTKSLWFELTSEKHSKSRIPKYTDMTLTVWTCSAVRPIERFRKVVCYPERSPHDPFVSRRNSHPTFRSMEEATASGVRDAIVFVVLFPLSYLFAHLFIVNSPSSSSNYQAHRHHH